MDIGINTMGSTPSPTPPTPPKNSGGGGGWLVGFVVVALLFFVAWPIALVVAVVWAILAMQTKKITASVEANQRTDDASE